MKDTAKTKQQLIKELEIMRERVVELERASHHEPIQELTREDKLFLAIVEQSPFSMWASKCKSGNYEIVLWNKGAEQIYGFSEDEAIGLDFTTLFVCDEEREQARIDTDKIVREGEVFRNFLAEDIAQDGSKKIVLTNCFRIWDDQEQEYLQVEIGLDVSELEKSEQKLRSLRELAIKQQAANERIKLLDKLRGVTTLITSSIHEEEGLPKVLRLIVDSVDDLVDEDTVSVICLYNGQDGKNGQLANPVLCIVNRDYSSVTSYFESDKDGLGAYAIYTKEAIFVDGRRGLPENYVKSRGQIQDRTHSIAVLPLVSGSEAPGVLFVQLPQHYIFSQEIEEALRLFAEQATIAVENARLIEKLRELNQLVAEKQEIATRTTIAVDYVHRMNNLAGPIRGWVGLIRERLDPSSSRDEELCEYLDEIENNVNSLLAAAKTLPSSPEEQNVDANFLLKAIGRNIAIVYPDVQIEKKLDSNLHPVRAIHLQLEDAIWNVVSNGLEAMAYKGILTLESRNVIKDGEIGVEVVIRDTGLGILDEERGRIFEIGYSTKTPDRGYGLWRSRHVIRDFGGTITFESKPGITTAFTIFLPAVSMKEDFK